MNHNNQQNELLYELFGALCNDTITPEQHQQLQTFLATDSEAREKYFSYMELHLNLERLHDERPETEIDFHFQSHVPPAAEAQTSATQTAKASQALWLLLTAVCAAIVGGFLFLSQVPSTTPKISQEMAPENVSVAQVTQTAAVRFAEGAPFLKVGSPIAAFQEYAISEGQLQLVFSNGAEVILTGPAVFESDGEDHLAVRYGSCSVYAPEGAEGFTVETPLSNVVDYGTRFSVNVSEAGNTDVQVIEGETDVRPIKLDENSGVAPKRLTKGMAQRLTTNNGLVVNEIPFDHAQYVSG
ncbi:MAG: FecR domain-containing protein, partial [Planctomycetaceae bacterium]|nr:FecR domain-containing protein [Planctomycetaceae bacterium]